MSYTEDKHTRGMSISEAIDTDAIDIIAGKVRHPHSLVVYSLDDAINNRVIDGESAWFISPSTKRIFSIQEAMDNKVMDSHGFWNSHVTGRFCLY